MCFPPVTIPKNGHEIDGKISPFGPAVTIESAAQSEANARAAEARIEHWRPFHFALTDLPRSKAWANSVAFTIEHDNAMLNPAVDTPKLYADGPTCVQAGASEDDMRALHPLTNEEIAALRMRAAAIRRFNQHQVDAMARSTSLPAASRVR